MIRKSWISWYIRKFKDAYLVLLCGKLLENLLTRMKLKTLQTLWKLDYLRFFWNYLVINYIFERKCIPMTFMWFWHHAMCDFSVITRFGFRSLCDNGIKSRSMLFHFGWYILPCCPWGEEFPWLCVGEAAAHGAKRPHAREVLFDALSLLPMGGEKNLEGMGEAATHGTKRLHTKEDNIIPVVNGRSPDRSIW